MVVALKLLKQLRPPHTISTILHRNLSLWLLSICRAISAVPAQPPLNPDSPSLSCLNQYKLVKSAAIAETWYVQKGDLESAQKMFDEILALS
ncbi:unnamed protein product [Malus baccata var. baccata]